MQMSLESWFFVWGLFLASVVRLCRFEADEADILRLMHRWREEASTWVNVGAYVD